MNPSSPRAFGRASLRDVVAYTPDADCPIDLSDNTNLWGTPPTALRAFEQAQSSWLARYPQGYSETLKDALAAYAGTTPDHIVVGCGSDDVLDAAIRACAEPGQRLAMMDPSFVMIPALARINGLEVVRIPLTPDYGPDAERLIDADATITYLCSPNNPTGVAIDRETIEKIVNETRGFVIVDEAYMEFGGTSAVRLASDRVLIARTMSKAFGLAGLRIGYGIGAPSLIAEIEKSRGPFKVSAPAEHAALAALVHDRDWVAARVDDAVASRERLIVALRTLGLSVLQSASNFVLVPHDRSLAITAALKRRNIAVRGFASLATVGPAMRITVGPWNVMEQLLARLQEVLVECA
ncbi:MAG TPA: histidinol-phosphate transaminase [Gemmatimonadaceae bacterium]